MMNYAMKGPACPHSALIRLAQIRQESMILLYQAIMHTGDKLRADQILPAIDYWDPVRFCQTQMLTQMEIWTACCFMSTICTLTWICLR